LSREQKYRRHVALGVTGCMPCGFTARRQQVEGGTVQLGKSLLGAVVGGAIGIGLVIATYYFFSLDHVGLAILVAVCVGLGVRATVATKGHASYLRGASTCLIAIGAFAASKFLIADLAGRGVLADVRSVKRVVAPQAEEAGSGQDASATTAVPAEMTQMDRRPSQGGVSPGKLASSQPFSTRDFIWLSVAALVAYELGRGTDGARTASQDGDSSATKAPA
jgi:hypothetical protein